jgi:transcriptional regulator GlxA family with amidase domain
LIFHPEVGRIKVGSLNFGFLVFPDLEELDLAGPWEMIGMWGRFFGGPDRRLLVSQSGGVVQCAKGLRVVSDCSLEDCPPLDYLLILGGQGTRVEEKNPALITFIRERAAGCRKVLGVCTGAFLLEAAGLLEGKKATTHWGSLARLREKPGVTVVEERIVRDGNIWTSAGVSAGIDLALALIAEEAGEETAGRVQLAAEYYPSHKMYGEAHLSPEAPAYIKAVDRPPQ